MGVAAAQGEVGKKAISKREEKTTDKHVAHAPKSPARPYHETFRRQEGLHLEACLS